MKVFLTVAVISTLMALALAQVPTPAPGLPAAGSKCEPETCEHIGNCTQFVICNKDTKTWTELECSDGLFWNPELNKNVTLGLKGGSCDLWVNLPGNIKDTYENDRTCFPPCYYKENGVCSANYQFHPSDTEHRILIDLSCPAGLVWNQPLETCDLSKNVAGC